MIPYECVTCDEVLDTYWDATCHYGSGHTVVFRRAVDRPSGSGVGEALAEHPDRTNSVNA